MTARSAARPVIAVGGTELPVRLAAALRTTVVDTDADGPDMCLLLFDDPTRKLLVDSGLDLATELTVTAGRVGDTMAESVFDGVVYAIGFDYDDRGAFTTVTAYDRSYVLYNGLHTKSYQNATDSDLATTIAGDAGLRTGTITPTTVVHEHVSQINETHFAFLSRRASESGNTLVVKGNELSFCPPSDAANAPAPGDLASTERLQLVPGANLQRMSVRVTAAQQVGEVEVRGWDSATKQPLVATSGAATCRAAMSDTPASVANLFGSPRSVTVDVPLSQQAECDSVAKAQAEHLGSACVHAEGTALGDPRLIAGAAVSLGQTGGRFDGKATLTRAKHIWDAAGYRTHFTASGSHDRSVLGLVSRSASAGAERIAGVVIGVVTNVADPDNLCRVRLSFPWLDDDYESDWVRILQLGAGADRGLQLLPEVKDEVLVGFEQGDSRRPYVLGGLFNGVDTPPRSDAVASDGKVVTRVWRSRSGNEVVLSDKPGSESVVIHTGKDEVTVTMNVADQSLTIATKGDVKVDAGGNAEVTAKGDLTVSATGSAKIKGTSGLTLESEGEVTIKGTTIKLN